VQPDVSVAEPGSNNWVLSGQLSATGKPIVANILFLSLGLKETIAAEWITTEASCSASLMATTFSMSASLQIIFSQISANDDVLLPGRLIAMTGWFVSTNLLTMELPRRPVAPVTAIMS
jgi:hypothetical protein